MTAEAPCGRDDHDLLSRMESGLAPDAHEQSCPSCIDARRRYERLGEALRELPALPAPDGWEQRVLASLPSKGRVRASNTRWLPWAGGLAVAAAAALILWQGRRPAPHPLSVRQEVVADASGRRADSAAVGDTIRISASGGDGPMRELRLYRDTKEVVARCPGDSGCREAGGAIELTIELGAPGSYRSLVIVGSARAPEPTGSLDDDARAAVAAGASVEISRSLEAE